ncbi:cation diffusion facilitator family transporter [Paracoccus tegillarcae]|uniref:Cation transporter n=1 Tax=Paracoccus tegillarcae TaxID=1529068 RepID=A0A2K9EFV2_9RHOB|nr:cation diffusion facilitator family transporter [Paracoccus tegillarcae]AUH33838.1 cation transporter [Paracoccus tegillarcae]
MANHGGSSKVVYTALAGNLAIAVTKYAAAFYSGSSSMLSEAIHSTVDTGNELLLLYGMKRSKRPDDPRYPLGNGREIYFWSFIVALMIFAMGAAVSTYQGVLHILTPEEATNHTITYIVLGLSFVFEFITWRVALRNLRADNPGLPALKAARRSKDPATFTVLLEDSAALVGLILAFVFILIAQATGDARWDGVGSICIGLVLAATSFFLARESKSLLMGERALPETEQELRNLIGAVDKVEGVQGIQTLQLGPEEVLLFARVDFQDQLDTVQIAEAIDRIERLVKENDPQVSKVVIEPASALPHSATG